MIGPKWRAPDFTGLTGWANSKPILMKDLRGKVVLVDFWTYTCINCLRTLPYLKRWHAKYSKNGLVIVGVHSPEFDFERDPKKVEGAVKRLGLKYPVAVDSDMETWKAFSNQYWPAKYLIDKDGYVVYTHFGEGGYEQTEREIQEALGIEEPLVNEIPKTYIFDQSPETYAGFSRNMGLGSGMVCDKDNCNVYIDQGGARAEHHLSSWPMGPGERVPEAREDPGLALVQVQRKAGEYRDGAC